MVDVTIGLPVYNGGETLARAFDQMLAQSYSNFRLIVSDNMSTDDTQRICERYTKLDSRIVYQRRQTRVSGSENFRGLVMEATTPYFMWISHDDIWHPDFIAKCVSRLRSQLAVVCVVPRSNHIYANGILRQDYGTVPLTGPPAQRLSKYLGRLDGNHRFYGLFRTDSLQRSFRSGEWFFAYDWLVVALTTLEGEHEEVPEILFEKFVNPRYHYYKSASFHFRDLWERILPGLRFSRELHANIPRDIWFRCLPQVFYLNLLLWAQRVQYLYPWTEAPIRVLRRIQKTWGFR
jgi:glycosyltransferase involved in cell wall biosynthesis